MFNVSDDPVKKTPSSVTSENSADPISLGHLIAYASPMVSISFLLGPVVILQGIYAKYFGLSLTSIATVILIARLFDAVTDPVIGYLSDYHRVQTGSRKSFIISGGVLFVLSSYFLYTPDANVTTIYLLGWFLAFYLAWTLFEIPHLAWGAELSPYSQEKNKIYSFRALGTLLGQLLFFSVPLLPFFESNEFTPETLKWSALAAGLLMLPLLYICVYNTPNSQQLQTVNLQKNNKSTKKYSPFVYQKKRALYSFGTVIFGNKPFLLFVAMYFFVGIGMGMWFALIFIFVDSYLGLGNKLALVYIISLSISTLSLGMWSALAARWGKKTTWRFALLIGVVGITSTGILTPGESGFIPLVMIKTLIMLVFAAYSIMVPSLLGDIIDYGTWRFGADHGATYFSFFTLMGKANMAVGSALGLIIAGWYGFNPASTTHTAEAVFGLRLAIAWVPALIVLVAVVCVTLTPINMRRHLIIRRRLNRRIA